MSPAELPRGMASPPLGAGDRIGIVSILRGSRPMLAVSEAQAIVLQPARPLPAEIVSLTPDALDLVLAEDVASDLDMPPFDKSLMDGYAVRAADLADGRATLA